MRTFWCLVVAGCGVLGSGCGSARMAELTAELEKQKQAASQLEAEKAQLTAQLAASQTDLAAARQELNRMAEIKRGYEEARTKMADSMKKLAPLVGTAESPLPPFEGLVDSNWVGKLVPNAGAVPGLKELQSELQGLLEGNKPKP
jgi:outer membrane murein-binding lipoprotein Lpp